MTKKISYTIKNTKPLDKMVLKRLIEAIKDWKQMDKLRLEGKEDQSIDAKSEYTVECIYNELDDIASMNVYQPINQQSVMDILEPKIKDTLVHINREQLNSFDSAVSELQSLVALLK